MILPDGGKVSLPALPLAIDGRRPGLLLDPPRTGAQSRDILAGLGISQDEIAGLIDAGIIETPENAQQGVPAEPG